jgi:hypothetical protein
MYWFDAYCVVVAVKIQPTESEKGWNYYERFLFGTNGK